MNKIVAAILPVLLDSTATAETPALTLNFDATELFSYANVITTSLMPVVYISAGFALGFSIIYMLKNAFGSRV